MNATDHCLPSCLPEHPSFCGREITFMADLLQNAESLVQVLCGFPPALHRGRLALVSPHLCFSFWKRSLFNMRDYSHLGVLACGWGAGVDTKGSESLLPMPPWVRSPLGEGSPSMWTRQIILPAIWIKMPNAFDSRLHFFFKRLLGSLVLSGPHRDGPALQSLTTYSLPMPLSSPCQPLIPVTTRRHCALQGL